jgi:hypothetical protein
MLSNFFGCKKSDTNFPDRQSVLTSEFSNYENFFPIATVDLSKKGIADKIHLIYVYFDPANTALFPDSDNIDTFTFSIDQNGLYKPSFDKDALVIGKDYEKYFIEGKQKYNKVKSNNADLSLTIDYNSEPEWWQDDETPRNSKGENYKYICQVDIIDITNDDCRMYVFYDQADRKVKCVYQRT